ncbi:MAG: hypothetical protein R2850_07835 [Bacteroidia bacterium]
MFYFLEETVIQKLLMESAEKDSVTVGDDLADNELNKKNQILRFSDWFS